MPPRLRLSASRSLTLRTKSCIAQHPGIPLPRRPSGDHVKDFSTSETPECRNPGRLPRLSKKAAAVEEVTHDTSPNIEEHGTLQQQIREHHIETTDKASQLMKKSSHSNLNSNTHLTGASRSRLYSTTTRRNAELVEASSNSEMALSPRLEYSNRGLGHKFDLPDMPLPRTEHFKRRYDPVVEQLTKGLMRHGKLSVAQKNMSVILDTLRTAPPPQPNPARPLLGSFPPAPILPLSPLQYLTAAIDSVAPLIKIRQQKGVMGGGASLPIPVPLGVQQRRRTAMQWILSSADKRRETRLADRVAREIISVAEGKSSAWERRAAVHKMGVSARSNVRLMMTRRRR